MARQRLSVTEQATLDVIEAHPGLTPKQIYQHVKATGIGVESISTTTSVLTQLKRVNRIRYGTGFIYFGKECPLPDGHTEWNNKSRGPRRRATRDRAYNGGNAPVVAAVVEAPPPIAEVRKGRALVTLQYGNNGTLMLTIEEAREIFADLDVFFGDK